MLTFYIVLFNTKQKKFCWYGHNEYQKAKVKRVSNSARIIKFKNDREFQRRFNAHKNGDVITGEFGKYNAKV